ncbi:MAG: BACON domain-containing protein, partial [Prevotella sp.]|nr:BACON domain-containing protein [Prevotella sp.]
MKLRYFIPSLVAVVAAMFTGCSDDKDPTYLSEIRVSQSYVSLNTSGGSNTINVEATGSWTVSGAPEWLTVSPASGNGNGTITFSAEAAEGRSAEVLISCQGQTQRINVIQGLATVSNATCAEVIAGPDSKTYRVTGTVKSIANTTYGNWYLQDKTGEVYIYGTLDAKGAEKNFTSLGLEVGDEVTVEGPKTTYNGTVELVNVTVIKINKSLIKCDSLTV